MDRLLPGVEAAYANVADGNWLEAAQAIMTTDTVHKAASTKAYIDGTVVTITGISKGSGMIEPHMATMLGFIVTDAAVAGDVLRAVIKRGGRPQLQPHHRRRRHEHQRQLHSRCHGPRQDGAITSVDDPRTDALVEAVTTVAGKLARSMIRDGEGATKFITIHVEGAQTEDEALKVCYSVAHSPLVKTAFFASDPNLGRILAAVGNSGIADLNSAA